MPRTRCGTDVPQCVSAETPNQSFSGNEFVGIIGRVEDYQRGDPENKTGRRHAGRDQDRATGRAATSQAGYANQRAEHAVTPKDGHIMKTIAFLLSIVS